MFVAAFAVALASHPGPVQLVGLPGVPDNPAIDMPGHIRATVAAAEHRRSRRVTEADFVRMSREPGTVVLDARSRDKFDLLHVDGAVNLPFPDIDVASLKRVLPDKSVRVLIYCNNNFVNEERTFPTKSVVLSLNLSTYTALHASGYPNVYELAPRIDPAKTTLKLVPTRAAGK